MGAIILARPAPDPRPDGRPILSSAKISDGNRGVDGGLKPKSIFESSGNHPSSVRMGMGSSSSAGEPKGRPLVFAKPSLGQEKVRDDVPAAPPVMERRDLQQVLVREAGPQGLSPKEASDMAAVIEGSVLLSSEALADNQPCIGVDAEVVEKAKSIASGMKRFSSGAAAGDRLDVRPTEIETIQKVMECGEIYAKLKAASKSRMMAFVAGGLIIGAVVLVATS